MNFVEAMTIINSNYNKKIHRKDRFFEISVCDIGLFLKCNLFGSEVNKYVLTINDILANDWEIYQEEPKLHTFEEALTAMKNKKTIYRIIDDEKMYQLDFNICFSKVIMFTLNDLLATDWIIED